MINIEFIPIDFYRLFYVDHVLQLWKWGFKYMHLFCTKFDLFLEIRSNVTLISILELQSFLFMTIMD